MTGNRPWGRMVHMVRLMANMMDEFQVGIIIRTAC